MTAHLTTRPLRADDAREVYELMAACELADLGEVVIEEADIVGDWQRPSFDIADSTLGVHDGERLVGYVELNSADRADLAVHPSHRDSDLGPELAGWVAERARRGGADVVGMPLPEGSWGDRMLAGLGWEARWTSWVLRLPEGASVPARDLPPGHTIRAAEPAELPTLHEVVEDAFLEWSRRERESYADFEAAVLRRPGTEPWMLRVALDETGHETGDENGEGAGEVVGVCLVSTHDETAYVNRLAVRRDRRNQGIAQAMLVDAFAVARDHGSPVAELSTDSRTGALPLYERVGMVVTSTWVNRATAL